MEPTTPTTHSGRSRLVQAVAALAALLVVGLLTIEGSRAAFSATTDNGVNTFAAGTVDITDDDAGSIMFTLTDMTPGATATRCINVTYTGSTTADIKLYSAVGGTGLAPYLDTVIDVGTGAAGGNTFDCTGFGSPVNAYTDTLSQLGADHTNYADGNGTNFAGATTNTTRSYRVTVTLQDLPAPNNNDTQGLNADTTITWEAQNI